MMNQLSKKQKIIIALIVITLIGLLVLSYFLTRPVSVYGSGISVSGYDKYISNLPADRRDSINTALYKIVKDNSNNSNVAVKDASIRSGSVTYNYDKTTNVNSGSFIVDMQSIKQSYLITYEWSTDSNNPDLSGYSSTASCLPIDKLMYGDFSCQDSFSSSDNTKNRDPILDLMPYSTFNYVVTANTNDPNKVELDANIILYSADTRDGNRDKSITNYETEITDWIKSKGLNPTDYLINYTISG
jgi:hypothetical protein